MTEQSSLIHDNPDFTLLEADDYTRYFELLRRVFDLLAQSYRVDDSENSYEAAVVGASLGRLLYTVETLRLKYTHSPAYARLLWVDLTDSGFPNAQEVSALGVDLLHREERLRDLPAESMLKSLTLDYLFKYQQEPVDFLWQLAERGYLEMLDESKLFMPFMLEPDNIIKQEPTRKDMRTYLASWACYDFKTNRPYVHVMTFEQNNEADPLEHRKVNHAQLLEVIRAEGGRVPDVGILAMAIDDALEPIHPKILKRIGIGPLYTPLLLEQEGAVLDEGQGAILELLEAYGDEDDFVLFITDEIVFSRRQSVTNSLFAPGGRVRELFHIPESDPESYARRASVIHRSVLLPHALAQHLDEVTKRVPELDGARVLSYDANGTVHG